MKRKFSYSMKEMNYRLLMMGRPIWKYIGISTLASTLGALSHMGLMGFGALWLLAAAGFCDGAGIYAALTAVCAVLIAVCRYLEGVFSHLGAYGILAKMRVHLFDAIDRIAPAYLIGRETGDVMNIAVSDIETLEYFFAHTIGPMFTVILLPTTTVVIAWCVNPLYALVLIPIYLIISVLLPLAALKAGRGIGMRYREQLGDLKSKILESVYSIRDIQIFGAGQRRMQVVEQANGRLPVLAGTGCVSTTASIALAKEAERLGADALSVISPWFAAASQEELYRHFMTVADSVQIPVFLYNIPARTGVNLSVDTVRRLAQAGNIAGIKDSSGNFDQILQYIEATPSDFTVLSGNDSLVLWTLQAGGKGGICGIANLFPETMVSIYELWRQGRFEKAKKVQDSIRAIRNLFRLGNPNTIVKLAANLLGQPVGPCRRPFWTEDEKIVGEISRVLKESYFNAR